MNVHFITQCVVEHEVDCLVLPVFEGEIAKALETRLLQPEDRTILSILVEKKQITGKENFYLPTPMANYESVLILGLGKKEGCASRKLREATGKAAATISAAKKKHLFLELAHTELCAGSFVEGLMLGQYRYDEFRTLDKENPPVAVSEICVHAADGTDLFLAQAHVSRSIVQAESVNWARDLGNAPGNAMTPSILAARASAMGTELGAEVTVLGEKEMTTLGMGSLLAVAQGSDEEAKLICLKYSHPKATKTVALVGKGLTFDAGGISIKGAKGMEEMKFDMCGAAAVLGAMRDILHAKPMINVVCVVPSTENLINGKAVKPGDIVKSMSGKTIEIYNTDAEGRLILCDAMTWTLKNHKPDFMIDIATLTGAVITGLGHHCAAIMSKDDEMAAALIAAGDESSDRLWRLPLWEEHTKLMKGKDADLCNIGPGYAGTITAGAFLSVFAEGTRWAHLDIAGTAWNYKGSSCISEKLASGFGVRLLSNWVNKLAE